MKKSTKGALAGAAAAVLLMGGFGTHAAWNDDAEVPGGAINTGHLNLTSSCGGWDLVNGATTTTFTDATLDDLLMVPGDVLSRLCTFTVHIAGDNLANATLSFGAAPAVKDGSAATLTEFTASADFTDVDGDPILAGATLTDGQVVKAKLSVQLASTITGLQGQDLQGLLDSLTVTVSQT
jgi:alternate signal-mediated exported protein